MSSVVSDTNCQFSMPGTNSLHPSMYTVPTRETVQHVCTHGCAIATRIARTHTHANALKPRICKTSEYISILMSNLTSQKGTSGQWPIASRSDDARLYLSHHTHTTCHTILHHTLCNSTSHVTQPYTTQCNTMRYVCTVHHTMLHHLKTR